MRRPAPTARMTPARAGRMYGVRLVAAGLLALGGSLLAGCSSAHDSFGTSNGGCFVALPAAGTAVHHHGKLLGARLVAVKDLHPRGEGLVYQATQRAKKVKQVCLVAFTGTFSTGAVDHPLGKPEGRLAIVVIEYPNGHLLATVIVNRLPNRFGHTHLG